MKTLTFNRSMGMLMSILLATVILMGCSKEDDHNTSMKLPDSQGYSKSLNDAEKQGLTYMVEQQKLLQNIYECMFENHGEAIFKQNAISKKQQTLLLSAKIDKYGIPNPLVDKASGVFCNPLLQEAFDQFKSSGNMQLSDCIMYSKTMEEAVIADLEVLISEVQGNDDLIETYRKILETSQANLAALFQGTKGLIDLALWYDPNKIFEPPTLGLRNISRDYDPIKDF